MRCVLIAVTAASITASVGASQAGGFSRGVADTDILYEEGNFNFRAGAVIVMPTHKFSSAPAVQGTPGLVGTNYLDTYAIPSAAVKLKITDNVSCAGTYTDSFGGEASYVVPYGLAGKNSEGFTVAEFGATCALFYDVGPGRLALIGGAFVEKFDYELRSNPLPSPLNGAPLDLDLSSNAYGWRAGLGYEIPDIAFRAQLMYRSGTSHEAEGSGTIFGSIPLDSTGQGELPQSVELKVQSGIAPGWLAFGSVMWTDWSVNETLDLQFANPEFNIAEETFNQYFWKDGWTISGGVGHAFNENVSGLLSVTWNSGVSTGYDVHNGNWQFAAGLGVKDAIGGELRFGGGFSYLTSGEIDASDAINRGAAVDSGWAGILAANYSVKW